MPAKPLYVIEHWAVAEPDAGRRHLIAHGHDVRVVEPWRGETLPVLTGDEAGVMIMGGPQMVTDLAVYPYLSAECALIEQAMVKSVPLVGVCLGSQLIAHVLGATVADHPDGQQGLGFHDLTVTDAGRALLPERLTVLLGNRQGWSTPPGATMLAHAGRCPSPNQAFLADQTTIGLQFHPEVTRTILDQWQTEFAGLIGRPGTQSKSEQDDGFARHDAVLKAWYFDFLDRWFQTHLAT
ncbi:type 1 glutamine amidotransferase [Oceaniradius stylonematis]|uniref:type 1 glutamine amidotransferase n=1 Tax=Oceaniradius stylonematis TaxID=2184161 RepID=UPI00273E2C18|nr:gamma-glutamyl-gamma-aminobutyrate hydrolase family protein [Oceaniradius stylonematis]